MSKYVPILALCLAISAMLFIPLKITSYGFLPPDDALRHSAKAVSDKSWDEILVIREDIKMDSHPGWHAILGAVHKATGCDADALVTFSVVSLFVLFCVIPAFMLRRPEAWIASLLTIIIVNPWYIDRLVKGRPYIFTMCTILCICFLWPRLKDKKIPHNTLAALTLLVAASTWIHCSWYLFALPIA